MRPRAAGLPVGRFARFGPLTVGALLAGAFSPGVAFAQADLPPPFGAPSVRPPVAAPVPAPVPAAVPTPAPAAPAAAPAPVPAAVPTPAPAAPAGPMRYAMRDGTEIVGTLVSEDETTVTLQTELGNIRFYRANIASVQAVTPTPAAPTGPAPAMIQGPGVRAASPPFYPYGGYGYYPPIPPRQRPPGRGLVVAGTILFSVFYGLTALGTISSPTDSNATLLLIPVLGPIFWMGASGGAGGAAYGAPFLIFDAVSQGAGLIMLIAGLLVSKAASTHDTPHDRVHRPSVAVLPTAGPGLLVAASF